MRTLFWLRVWGVFWCAAPLAAQQATPVTSITAPPGVRVELLRSAQPGEGSWISLTLDDRGRFLLGRDDAGWARLTPAPQAGGAYLYERLDDTLKHNRGILFHGGAVHLCSTDGRGVHRFRDAGDDRFTNRELLFAVDYRSRYGHGTNQMIAGPGGLLYLIQGDDVAFPDVVSLDDSPYRHLGALRSWPDPRDAGQHERVGHVLEIDPATKSARVIAGGLRNAFDLAVNAEGEMFTWDADMEWDVGLPWYRPTRLLHLVSGGEYGWRFGHAAWPDSYPDSLPPLLETGLGSPTGMEFCGSPAFPDRWRGRLFMADWQNGRILAVRLTPRGASYDADAELFLEGAPLNVCDLAFGNDGALYFITGGRGSQSGLYRARWTPGAAEPAPDPPLAPGVEAAARAARDLRKRLAEYHTRPGESLPELVWKHLDDSDRYVRFAARVALERQPLARWKSRALAERDPARGLAALLAWTRSGGAADQAALWDALGEFGALDLAGETLLTWLRAQAIAVARHGEPDEARWRRALAALERRFPHPAPEAQRELCELLAVLRSEQLVPRLVSRLDRPAPQEETIDEARRLARCRVGWTIEARRRLATWLSEARRFQGGRLVSAAIKEARDDFLAGLSAEDRAALAPELARFDLPPAEAPAGPARARVRAWTLAELRAELPSAPAADPRGPEALVAAGCLKCHRFGSQGAAVGPDLTRVGKRYDLAMILESIVEPSRQIDPKYRLTTWQLSTGQVHTGRTVAVSAKEIVIETNPLTQEQVKLPREQIELGQPSNLSPMPAGLLDVLTREEILALLSCLKSGPP